MRWCRRPTSRCNGLRGSYAHEVYRKRPLRLPPISTYRACGSRVGMRWRSGPRVKSVRFRVSEPPGRPAPGRVGVIPPDTGRSAGPVQTFLRLTSRHAITVSLVVALSGAGAGALSGPSVLENPPSLRLLSPSTSGVPPTLAAEIQINGNSIAAGTSYSEHPDNKFTVSGIIDEGVGVDRRAIRIDVGDCAMNPADESINRSEAPFISLYENVQTIFDLPEEDALLTGTGRTDDHGVDCYVAELISMHDRLGNTWTDTISLQTKNFGVDKQSAVIDDIRVDESTLNSIPEIRFRIRDPPLASGDDGTPVLDDSARATIRDSIEVGRFSFDLSQSRRATALLTELSGDGAYTVQLAILDSAKPPNVATASVQLTYDRSAPILSKLRGPNTLIYASGSITLQVSGSVQDAVAGVDDIDLQVRNNSATPRTCDSNDRRLPTSRGGTKRIRGRSRKSVAFDETLTLQPPRSNLTAPEPLCVFARASDAFGNTSSWRAVSRFAVDW